MKNQKLRKALLLVVSALLLMSLTVMGTLAYLADTTETVQNTFTVGNVKFDDDDKLNGGLDEAKTNNLGIADTTADRVTSNEYKLLPGITYVKDPTIHLSTESDPCFVRAKVTVTEFGKIMTVVRNLYNNQTMTKEEVAAKITDCVGGYDTTVWEDAAASIVFDNETNPTTVTYEFRVRNMVVTGTDKTYKGAVVAETDETPGKYGDTNAYDIVLFETITTPKDLSDEDLQTLKTMQINIVAHAIQAEGFETAADAWKGFDATEN